MRTLSRDGIEMWIANTDDEWWAQGLAVDTYIFRPPGWWDSCISDPSAVAVMCSLYAAKGDELVQNNYEQFGSLGMMLHAEEQ